MLHIAADVFIDFLHLLPFLYLTYLLLEFIEHKAENLSAAIIKASGKLGPAVGAALGVIPQCGFSVSASHFYSQRLISAGTLIAVFLSTSDEMLPVFIAQSVSIKVIISVLFTKFAAGTLFGFLADRIFKPHNHANEVDIHSMCSREGCSCEGGNLFLSALKHTVKIGVFIYIVSFLLHAGIHLIGEDALASIILNKPVIGPMISALVGLIPNCAASVVITQLFLSGAMTTGAMLSGLLAASGIGMLILFRVNRGHFKENLGILGYAYAASVFVGIFVDFIGLIF